VQSCRSRGSSGLVRIFPRYSTTSIVKLLQLVQKKLEGNASRPPRHPTARQTRPPRRGRHLSQRPAKRGYGCQMPIPFGASPARDGRKGPP
jgi:hypothetical protein